MATVNYLQNSTQIIERNSMSKLLKKKLSNISHDGIFNFYNIILY